MLISEQRTQRNILLCIAAQGKRKNKFLEGLIAEIKKGEMIDNSKHVSQLQYLTEQTFYYINKDAFYIEQQKDENGTVYLLAGFYNEESLLDSLKFSNYDWKDGCSYFEIMDWAHGIIEINLEELNYISKTECAEFEFHLPLLIQNETLIPFIA